MTEIEKKDIEHIKKVAECGRTIGFQIEALTDIEETSERLLTTDTALIDGWRCPRCATRLQRMKLFRGWELSDLDLLTGESENVQGHGIDKTLYTYLVCPNCDWEGEDK